MFRPEMDSRIYLLDEDDRGTIPDGLAVIGPDGVREEIPQLAYRAVQHVLEAMRAGRAVKIVPLRTELPIDEAADAIGMARDELREYVAEGAVPFRSTQYVDWVNLAEVIEWNNQRYEEQGAALDAMMADDDSRNDEE
ncbi:hypothetical protein EV649_0921 [Kribbella sp. VKM Ac-2569]|uniref:hypothetical protein n=1 Tax=Kribbella sp. VKM Ac-2569 TaxID=2512220 RepID=UPI00102A9FFF|nr:hypothetical protein [Kribbella sp. VKM Ac-2569]RZT27167.1 hypothetical protein EV649_0921 [Kribbella sp. VKM Ac-2569]